MRKLNCTEVGNLNLTFISIREVEKLSPTGVCTEKIKMLCSRDEIKDIMKNNERITEIEEKSKSILNEYGSLLGNSCVAFQEEAKII